MSFKYLYLIENVDHDVTCLLMITKVIHVDYADLWFRFMLINCWILDHV